MTKRVTRAKWITTSEMDHNERNGKQRATWIATNVMEHIESSEVNISTLTVIQTQHRWHFDFRAKRIANFDLHALNHGSE
jgi:hypothetical protein